MRFAASAGTDSAGAPEVKLNVNDKLLTFTLLWLPVKRTEGPSGGGDCARRNTPRSQRNPDLIVSHTSVTMTCKLDGFGILSTRPARNS